jgi:hypothetical protein
MHAEDFSVWLSGISRLSEPQRREAVVALLQMGWGREASRRERNGEGGLGRQAQPPSGRAGRERS